MKITFLLYGFPRKPVGGYKVVYEYANRLARNGHSVSLVHSSRVNGFTDRENVFKKIKSSLVYMHNRIVKPYPVWQKIEPAVKRYFIFLPKESLIPDADVIFATSWPLVEYILKYGKQKGERVYLAQHYEIWCGPKEQIDACWKSNAHKVVVSRWLYEIGKNLNASKVTYIPNGIDHSIFRLTVPLEDRENVIAMMSSNLKWKGSEEGLKTLILVKSKVKDMKAIIFGVKPPASRLPEWIKFYNNPTQDQLANEIYNKSSVFICSSHSEGFALPPAEAMACGCAVVTTDCGGIRDFASHNINALISPVGDIGLLTRHCQSLMEDSGLRIRLAKNGLDTIQELNWKNSVQKMEDFLTGCCKAG